MTRVRTLGSFVLHMLLAVSVLSLTGCEAFKAMAYYSSPKSEKMPAEFSRLAGKDTVVYVWAPMETLWDYPKFRLDVASYVSAYIRANVDDVHVVDPLQVESWIEKSSRSDRDPVEVGRAFGARMVVHVSVFNFSTRDPGMAHFYRGRMNGAVAVYDMTLPDQEPDRFALKDVAVVVPEEGAVGFNNASPEQVRQATYEAFTVAVGRKFHDWERMLD